MSVRLLNVKRIALTTMAVVCAPAVVQAQLAADPVFEPCRVKLQDEVRIPAEEAGVLVSLPVKEGSLVAKGGLLAQVDDDHAKARVDVARFGWESAIKRSQDDVEERYATKAYDVAKIDWEKALQANQMTKDAYSELEIEQKKLVVDRSELQIEKAQKDRELAVLDARTKEAEHAAAQLALDKLRIVAPFDGEVIQLRKHEEEWVSPGEHVLTFARFDKLYVETFVSASEFDRSEIRGRPVTVHVERARGREVAVTGHVVHVSQVVESGGKHVVRAEIENTMEGNGWAVLPGLKNVRMTIHMNGATQTTQVERAPSLRN